MFSVRYDPTYADTLHDWTPVVIDQWDEDGHLGFDATVVSDGIWPWSIFHDELGRGVEVSFL